MGSLKDQLFPDTNITGKADRNNQPILVGQTIKDNDGDLWAVYFHKGEYVVCVAGVDLLTHGTWMSLNLLMSLSDWVEIVVPAPEPDKATVAMAPLDKKYNLANLKVHKYKSVSTSKTRRLP